MKDFVLLNACVYEYGLEIAGNEIPCIIDDLPLHFENK